MHRELYRYIRQFYRESEFPALAEQINSWSVSKPFAGLRIVDATPVFRNTMVKYCALLAGGAKLFVPETAKLPADRKILDILPGYGIEVLPENCTQPENIDLIADCAGAFAHWQVKYGYVELTRSGLHYYKEKSAVPVFSADSGLLKKFETVLGTGDGMLRGMEKYGFTTFEKRRIIIFGGGKVGFGIAWHLACRGAETVIVDFKKDLVLPPGVRFVDGRDRELVQKEIANAWCAVSATGVKGALAELGTSLTESKALLVNMGAEDEFGAPVSPERVLNGKQPLNFVLEEPTRLKYIDPTMALDNAGLLLLSRRELPPGISLPSEKLEKQILDIVSAAEIPAEDIALITEYDRKQKEIQ